MHLAQVAIETSLFGQAFYSQLHLTEFRTCITYSLIFKNRPATVIEKGIQSWFTTGPRGAQCGAALYKENVMPAEVPAGQIARGNEFAELEPDGNIRLNKFRARPDPSPDRGNTVRTREKKEPSVTRIEGKWAFKILSELQHGSAQLSELCASLRPASRKTLKRHLRQLESGPDRPYRWEP